MRIPFSFKTYVLYIRYERDPVCAFPVYSSPFWKYLIFNLHVILSGLNIHGTVCLCACVCVCMCLYLLFYLLFYLWIYSCLSPPDRLVSYLLIFFFNFAHAWQQVFQLCKSKFTFFVILIVYLSALYFLYAISLYNIEFINLCVVHNLYMVLLLDWV